VPVGNRPRHGTVDGLVRGGLRGDRMMLRRLLFLLAALVAAAPLAHAEGEIRVGFAGPLTGPFAASGARSRLAVEMAVRDLNDQGGVLGRAVELIVADDACGIDEAVSAAHQLVDAGVHFVVGHMCSHSSLMAAGIYDAANVLMISPSSTHPRLTEEGRGNVFRLVGRDDHQGRLAADFLHDHWTGKEVALVHDGSTYGEGLAAQVRRHLRSRGLTEAIYELYTPGATSYARLVSRLQQEAIGVLYIAGYGPDAGLILRTARERGYDLQVIGGDALGMDEFWTVAGRTGEGTIFSARPDFRDLPEAASVLARFKEQGFGTRMGGSGSYAAVQVWAGAVARSGSAELAAVAAMLRRGRFGSILGPVAFDGKGDLEGAVWQWQIWTNGDHQTLVPQAPTQ